MKYQLKILQVLSSNKFSLVLRFVLVQRRITEKSKLLYLTFKLRPVSPCAGYKLLQRIELVMRYEWKIFQFAFNFKLKI